jgi:mono/diheme cytochrome c family protein
METIMKFAAAALLLVATVGPASADAVPMVKDGKFIMQDGEAIFKNVCQGCHMPDAKGAVGAGAYPALAGDAKLEESGYPVGIVIHGQKGMPPFGPFLSDAQVAAVVNYVRSHFGNHFSGKVTAADAKLQR